MRTLLLLISFFFLTVSASATNYYTVKRGDTLEKIAKKFGVSVSEIKRLNRIKGSIIYVGQKLKIPVKRKSSRKERYLIYKVKQGDSLGKIAKRFGTTVSEIKRINRIRGNIIYPGQKLKIPVKAGFSQKKLRSRKNEKKKLFVPNGLTKVPVYKYYRVKKGDSVIKIAKKFHVSPRSIIRINRLRKPYILRPGQRLKILVGYKDVLKLNRPIQFLLPLLF